MIIRVAATGNISANGVIRSAHEARTAAEKVTSARIFLCVN